MNSKDRNEKIKIKNIMAILKTKFQYEINYDIEIYGISHYNFEYFEC